MLNVLQDDDDPLQGHPRYAKIRWASPNNPNIQVALDRQTNKNVAIKFFARGVTAVNKRVRRQLLHQSALHHKHVVQLHRAFLTTKHLCIVMELGEQNLWQYMLACGGVLTENVARNFFCQMLLGLEHCHGAGVANRDIKLENTVLFPTSHGGQIVQVLKICGFGFCQNSEKDSVANSLVGTSVYVSPEVLHQASYDAKLADIWSCGVVLYYMIEGRFPFGTETTNGSMEGLFARITSMLYDPPMVMSPEAAQVIAGILVGCQHRLRLSDIKDCWWVRQGLTEYNKTIGCLPNPQNTAEQDESILERIVEEARIPPSGLSVANRIEHAFFEATLGDPVDSFPYDGMSPG